MDKNLELNQLIEIIKNNKKVTLLYSAKSLYNNAVALEEYLEKILNMNNSNIQFVLTNK